MKLWVHKNNILCKKGIFLINNRKSKQFNENKEIQFIQLVHDLFTWSHVSFQMKYMMFCKYHIYWCTHKNCFSILLWLWFFQTYCIFSVRLLSRKLELTMHHLQKIQLQRHPTSNCHSPKNKEHRKWIHV